MSLLAAALQARLPLVAVHTDDPVNAPLILSRIAKVPAIARWYMPAEKERNAGKLGLIANDLSYYSEADYDDVNWVWLYQQVAKAKAQLIVINPPDSPLFFNAGQLLLPEAMLFDFVCKYAPEDVDDKLLYELQAALRGLTLKDMHEVSRLAMAEFGEFTSRALLAIRRQRIILSHGLQLVDTEQVYYAPSKPVRVWLATDGVLFKANVPDVIRPRGLLLSGEPGVGKTSGAKYIANKLGLPLYRLELAGILQKYVGESEKALRLAFEQLASLAPCVLLIDEVEKVFTTTTDDSGTSTKILSMMLWWLQEHHEQILTVMTTNDTEQIPAELTRPGRLDATLTLDRLHPGAVEQFVKGLRRRLEAIMKRELDLDIDKIKPDPDTEITQAALTAAVLKEVKTLVRLALKEGT